MASSTPGAALLKEEELGEHGDKPSVLDQTGNPSAANPGGQSAANEGQAVRFASQLQEIEPAHSLHSVETLTQRHDSTEPMSAEAQAELRNLSRSLRENYGLQKRRMSNFAFEPVSLPASRLPSNEAQGSRQGSMSSKHNPSISSMHTPPLTPSGSSSRAAGTVPQDLNLPDITPETSGPQGTGESATVSRASTPSAITKQSSSDTPSAQASAISSATSVGITMNKKIDPTPAGRKESSVPASREESPARASGTASGTATPPGGFSRPFTPAGDVDDPYARSKRPPQSRNPAAIDDRFKFGSKDTRRHSSLISGALPVLPRTDAAEAKAQDKPSSSFLAPHAKRDSLDEGKPAGSMADLKRFFHFGHHKKHQAPSASKHTKSGHQTPPHHQTHSVPFADDHGLESKYGKFGKVLGSGAGGSVRLLKRSSDGVTFAVKQFRERHPNETEKEYTKKVTAEFCVGSTLHHGNIIETMDIINERGHWYEVMEYAPYDLFAIVMTGKMSREEIACCFLQIVAGVTYLHSMGLAHRDLKLDNVVVNEHGIMKIIDFGSAIVFKYPFENDIVLASGVVGSDPYLAPEVYEQSRYDPQPTDIWSLAIIFACMSLRRFPWKAPRLSDNSYRLFVAAPSPDSPSTAADWNSSKSRASSAVNLNAAEDGSSSKPAGHHHSHTTSHTADASSSTNGSVSADPKASSKTDSSQNIRGPWRLLRLLPRESRNIISKMLQVDPKRRATLDDMIQDPWIINTPVCRQIDHGQIIKATGHTHTLEPGSAEQPEKKAK